MKEMQKMFVNPNLPIYESMRALQENSNQILLVVNSKNILLGTVTDGDIRKALLNNKAFDTKIKKVMNSNPITIKNNHNFSRRNLVDYMIKNFIKHLPVINKNGKVEDIYVLDEILKKEKKINPVVIMAGGEGNRLRPLTIETPKPLLKIGDKTILEIIINNFKNSGFFYFYLIVNYKSEKIKNYFQDGYQFGADIEYIEERKKLGTAGGLKYLENKIKKPFIVINGDILTKLNFSKLLDTHIKFKNDITVGIKLINHQNKYGLVKIDKNKIIDLVEKPVESFYINAGIYVINPELIKFLSKNKKTDITQFIKFAIQNKKKIGYYKIKTDWIDIGHLDDYENAKKCWK